MKNLSYEFNYFFTFLKIDDTTTPPNIYMFNYEKYNESF